MANNTIYGNPQNFNQLRDNHGIINIGFTEKRLTDWRNTFLQPPRHWGVGASIDFKKRSQFSKLNPPFILEDEGLIFDTKIGGKCNVACVGNIQYKNTFLKSGYILASESRLVFGDVQNSIINQVLYQDIRMVSYERDKDPTTITLILSDNIEFKMLLHLLKSSIIENVLGPILFGTANARVDAANIRLAKDFLDDLIEFFNEIADENRRRRKRQ